MSSDHVSPPPTRPAATDTFGPDLVDVFGPSQADGGPELIQLLTPEGERVHHPEFDMDFSADDLRGFYRDMVLTSARRPRRSVPAEPCARRTTSSRPIASTASPGAAASTPSSFSDSSAASTTAAGIPPRSTSASTRS
jgi:hypothetical protein